MNDQAYLIYDPDGRGLLIALVYRILKSNDVVGWYYGYVGNGAYEATYFQITRGETLEPIRFYAGSSRKEWDRDYLLSNQKLDASVFVPDDVQELLDQVRQGFLEYWLVRDEKINRFKLNDERLREMELEEDDSYSYASAGLDRNLVALLAKKWSLQAPIPDFGAEPPQP